MLSPADRAAVESARVGRLATADGRGRPHVVPVCFALVGDAVVVAIDEKPKRVDPHELRRVRDVRENPFVALVVDRYAEEWDRLWWVQLRGRAVVVDPGEAGHAEAVVALRAKYDQYAAHALDDRPLLRIDVGHAVSWGDREE